MATFRHKQKASFPRPAKLSSNLASDWLTPAEIAELDAKGRKYAAYLTERGQPDDADARAASEIATAVLCANIHANALWQADYFEATGKPYQPWLDRKPPTK